MNIRLARTAARPGCLTLRHRGACGMAYAPGRGQGTRWFLTLVIIGATVFFLVVKPVNLIIDRFRLSPAPPSPATKTCPDCFTDIPAKASRCPNCTSELSPPARQGAPA